jgi:hypothetical protein
MEATGFKKMLVHIYQITQRHIPKYRNIYPEANNSLYLFLYIIMNFSNYF